METEIDNPKNRPKHYEIMFNQGANKIDDFGFYPNPPCMYHGYYGELLAYLNVMCKSNGVSVWTIEEVSTFRDIEPVKEALKALPRHKSNVKTKKR